ESSVFQSNEALKAMAVAARTYAVRMRGRHAAEGYDFCDKTHCQHLDLGGITPKLEAVVAETAGELLWYAGKPAFTPYSRDCGGQTEDAAAVWPEMAASYLTHHDDPYCARAAWRWVANPGQAVEVLRRAVLRAPRRLNAISIVERTASGRARTLALTGSGESIRISAGSFRFAIARELGWNTLRSDWHEVEGLAFQGRGSGHGVGLCQEGADRMGLAGRGYREILAFYYPGTAVGVSARGLPWRRLGGDRLTLWTTQPEQDGAALAIAERLTRSLEQRTGWQFPAGVELRVFPDVETFRNATGEPGWVAARTEGRRIQLQPLAVLRSRGALEDTLSHELLHAMVDAQATTGLPVWFREGLVEYLLDPSAARSAAAPPSDGQLRQKADPGAARRAYVEATGAVAGLVRRYGRATVFGWVKTGLPSDAGK
ncbi:MAG TPA: SpoIID/LytB domain-containing protein, partial [Bryobacteraceae bacterium]|nr:SpoIID/LytB domain-containing protein [Bryobacteraceae bacterium]